MRKKLFQFQAEQDEIKSWAKEQGIDLSYMQDLAWEELGVYRGKGMGWNHTPFPTPTG